MSYLPLLLIVLALVLRVVFVQWLRPWCWALSMVWGVRRAHEDPEFVEYFYGPSGLNMLELMLKREDGMHWPFDPVGLTVAAPVVKRVVP